MKSECTRSAANAKFILWVHTDDLKVVPLKDRTLTQRLHILSRMAFLNNCRFLSDTRPSRAFYVSKTPDTIAALGSLGEHNPQVAVSLFFSLWFDLALAGRNLCVEF